MAGAKWISKDTIRPHEEETIDPWEEVELARHSFWFGRLYGLKHLERRRGQLEEEIVKKEGEEEMEGGEEI